MSNLGSVDFADFYCEPSYMVELGSLPEADFPKKPYYRYFLRPREISGRNRRQKKSCGNCSTNHPGIPTGMPQNRQMVDRLTGESSAIFPRFLISQYIGSTESGIKGWAQIHYFAPCNPTTAKKLVSFSAICLEVPSF